MRDIFLLAILAFLLWVWAYPRDAYFWYLDLTQAAYGEIDYD